MAGEAKTEFAPAERAGAAAIAEQAASLGGIGSGAQFCNAVNDLVLVLNEHRQIVFANRNVAAMLGVTDDSALRGLRPGEAIGCTHACESAGGCGTTKFCVNCGAVNAILTSQAGRQDVRECRILRDKQTDALDLLVRTTPIAVDGRQFTVCAIADISHEKRRRALERIFFHDVLNTALSLRMIAEPPRGAAPQNPVESLRILRSGIEQLIREISEQRDLMAAETSELAISPRALSVKELLETLVEIYRQYPAANGRKLDFKGPANPDDMRLKSDPVLLGRVLGNMIKNALEACTPGQTVTVGAERRDSGVEFWVHNPGEMPEAVQLQLFQKTENGSMLLARA